MLGELSTRVAVAAAEQVWVSRNRWGPAEARLLARAGGSGRVEQVELRRSRLLGARRRAIDGSRRQGLGSASCAGVGSWEQARG